MAIKRSTGLVDKLNGLKTDKLLNGAFESPVGVEWTATGATLTTPTTGQSGNNLTITNSGAASGSAYQDITTVVGRVYRGSFYFQKGTGVSGSVQIGTTATPNSLFSSGALTDATWTQYEFAFIATAPITRVTLTNDSAVLGETALFDGVFIEEVYDGLVEILKNCKCNIYSTPLPVDADSAATGTLLAVVSLNETATGLTFEPSANGIVRKNTAEIWKGNINVSGNAAWFRFYEDGDDPALSSTVHARLDGTIGTSSAADMIVGSTSLTLGLKFEITGFSYTAPKG